MDGGARVHPAWLASSAATSLAQLRADWTGTLRNPEGFRRSAAGNAVENLADLPEAPDSTSALSLLAAAVERLPPVTQAETRPDPILPVVQSVTEAPEREAGRMAFGGILDVGDTPSGQLPLFPAPDGPRVALLELTDAHGVPTMAQGRGAPLELAVYVGACILTPYDFRARRARLVTSVRELAAFLFGPGKWRPGRKGARPGDWQRVRDAALPCVRTVAPGSAPGRRAGSMARGGRPEDPPGRLRTGPPGPRSDLRRRATPRIVGRPPD